MRRVAASRGAYTYEFIKLIISNRIDNLYNIIKENMQNDIYQNLPKVGPGFSHVDEKQVNVVSMIKNYEVAPQLKVRINMEIPGLRKKKVAFSVKPNNRRLLASFISYERNGYMNVALSRNWTRLAFPLIPLFFFMYMW